MMSSRYSRRPSSWGEGACGPAVRGRAPGDRGRAGPGLGLHHGDLLHLALEDEEAVVVEVDALAPQQLADLGEGLGLAVHGVGALVGREGRARHDDLAAGHELEGVAAVVRVDDVREVHAHLGEVEVRVPGESCV